jgi:hypothetical protein
MNPISKQISESCWQRFGNGNQRQYAQNNQVEVNIQMREERPHHLSYLLRLWQAGRGQANWQASLESPTTGRRQGFSDLESLFDFIRAELQTKQLDRRHRIDDIDEGE